jgi:hypothetical protein
VIGRGTVVVSEGWGVISSSDLLPPPVEVAAREERSGIWEKSCRRWRVNGGGDLVLTVAGDL